MGKSLMREKVERLYISPPVLATQVARSRRNLGSCGSVMLPTVQRKRRGPSSLVWMSEFPLKTLLTWKEPSKSTMAGSREVLEKYERGRIFN